MLEYRIQVEQTHLEHISDELFLLGTDAITWQDAANQPIYEPLPGQVIVWSEVIISAIVNDIENKTAIEKYLRIKHQENYITDFVCQPLPQKDWVRSTSQQFKKTQYGERLWIIPSHESTPLVDQPAVILDPGLAFGTGSHPTTALCLKWLDKHILSPRTLIDFGCGSGILAISALKLGASKAYAIDHDPQALVASKVNAYVNEVEHMLTICDATTLPCIQADILIANITSYHLINLVKQFVKLLKPQGKIVLSGILIDQLEQVIEVFKTYFEMSQPVYESEWVLIEGIKISHESMQVANI